MEQSLDKGDNVEAGQYIVSESGGDGQDPEKSGSFFLMVKIRPWRRAAKSIHVLEALQVSQDT
jgi:hypothetical protein